MLFFFTLKIANVLIIKNQTNEEWSFLGISSITYILAGRMHYWINV